MIIMTNANMKNLPTTAAPAPQKSWDKRDRAIAAAVKALGPEARNGFEFTVEKLDGRWVWKATDADKIPPPTGFQLKINGGKRAFPTLTAAKPAEAVAPEDKAAGEAIAAAAVEKIMASAKNPADKPWTKAQRMMLEDGTPEAQLGTPGFVESDEVRDARIAKMKKTIGPERKIKDPPDTAKAKAKASKGKRAGGKGQTKTSIVGQLLLRKEGCTTADILKATGWPSVSVPAQAKAVGLGLRKEKDGKVTRYYGVPKK